MARKKTESVLGTADIVAIQGSRHGLSFIRSMLAGLKVKRYRSFVDAEAAFREMQNEPPSLVITDWELKARSGYWLITKLRGCEHDTLPSVPILVLTSEMSPSMLDVALDSGANSVVIKPISADLLRQRIESLVQAPQVLVEHEERLIPEGAKDILENRLRPLESRVTRLRRLEMKAALQQASDEAPIEMVPLPGAPEDAEGPDAFSWQGFSGA